MSHNKVVWSEGMFLRPQHFQQQDRYLEHYIDSRCNAIGSYNWGFNNYSLDTELLKLGKVGLASGRGVLPDGTPFNFPDQDPCPPVIQIPENSSNLLVYLCLPLKRKGSMEISADSNSQALVRYHSNEEQIRSNTSEHGEQTKIGLGKLNLLLKLSTDDLSGYACIGVVRIQDYLMGKPVKIDNQYIAPRVECHHSTSITAMLTELRGLLNTRGQALSHRLIDSGRSGSAEIADYLLLQVINRVEPLVEHLLNITGLHPVDCYQELVQIAGELSTFTTPSKRPPELPRYQHEDLQLIFTTVIGVLRQNLGMVLEQTAIALDLTERKYGIHAAPINDPSLIGSSTFVLAVKADMKANHVRNQFASQVKIAPVERIRELIGAQLPGIGLSALAVAPRQIPYHAGFTYFELDKKCELWQTLARSGGVAVHLGGEFPGLNMELWAIRD